MADPRLRRERGAVEELPRPSGAEGEETAERFQVADVRELADIALDVGTQVAVEPGGRVELPVVDAREEPAEEELLQGERRLVLLPARRLSELLGQERRAPGQLSDREGEELQNRHPTRQRLADPLRQQEVLRAREHQRAGPLLVEESLQIGEEVRSALHLVEDHPCPAFQPPQEAPRVLLDLLTVLQIFEREVVEVGEGGPRQGRLAGLPRSGEEHGRECRGQGAEAGLECTRVHGRLAYQTRGLVSIENQTFNLHGEATTLDRPRPGTRRAAG